MNAGSLDATGSGYCSAGGFCDNTDINLISNSYSEGGQYNNWYAFSIPNLGGITSATLQVVNTGSDFSNSSTAVYTLYQETSFTYNGLVGGGTPLGQVNVSSVDTGLDGSFDITLNAAALTLLSAAQGSTFVFGGTISNYGSAHAEVSGYQGSGAQLVLNQGTVSDVPEPSTIGLSAIGIAGFAWIRRSRVRS